MAMLAVEMVSAISTILEYNLLVGIAYHTVNKATLQADAEASDKRQIAIQSLTLLAYIVTAVGVLRWIYQADSNLHATVRVPLEFTPGWAVGWYFIPVLTLWNPYLAMREIWRASFDPIGKAAVVPWILPVWWFLWLTNNVAASASYQTSQYDDVNMLLISNLTSLASSLADMLTALLLLWIIARVTAAQLQLPAFAASRPAPPLDPRAGLNPLS